MPICNFNPGQVWNSWTLSDPADLHEHDDDRAQNRRHRQIEHDAAKDHQQEQSDLPCTRNEIELEQRIPG